MREFSVKLHPCPHHLQLEAAERRSCRLNLHFLNALISDGFVEMGNFQKSENKFKYVDIFTPTGIAQKSAVAELFLKRKIEEYACYPQEVFHA